MKDTISCFVGSAVSWILTGVSLVSIEEITSIISCIMSIIVSVVTLGLAVWSWYKKAKSDGEITSDEIDDLIDIVNKEDKDDGSN